MVGFPTRMRSIFFYFIFLLSTVFFWVFISSYLTLTTLCTCDWASAFLPDVSLDYFGFLVYCLGGAILFSLHGIGLVFVLF